MRKPRRPDALANQIAGITAQDGESLGKDREWLEVGRFLRDFDAMLSDHADDFPEAPDGFVFEFTFGQRGMDAKMRRARDLRTLLLPHPDALEVFSLCWGMRSQRQGNGTLSLRLWTPHPHSLSAHEKLEAKVRWAKVSG